MSRNPGSIQKTSLPVGHPRGGERTADTFRRSGGQALGRSVLWADPLRRRLLGVADALAVLLACLTIGLPGPGLETTLWASVLLPLWILLAKVQGLYDKDHRALRHLTVDELPGLFIWSLGGTAAMMAFLALATVEPMGIESALAIWLVAGFGAFVLRAFARQLWRWITPPERALIVGEGPLAHATRRKLDLFPDIHVRVVAERAELNRDDFSEGADGLVGLDRVILASQAIDEQLIAELVLYCRRARLKLSVVPPARGMFGTAVQLNHVADLPVVEYNTAEVSRSTLLLKRALDLTVASAMLVLLAPVLGLIALTIRLDSRGPALFAQRRAGKNGDPFTMYKFRTMVADADARLPQVVAQDALRDPLFKLKRDPRVTRMGRVLRRASLDELPQLWNVVKGEMSLVGPRPEETKITDHYSPVHRFRLTVKPGMTGPMQVYGRGELSLDERLSVEREYIENLSIGRDFRIIALTVAAVFTGKGAF